MRTGRDGQACAWASAGIASNGDASRVRLWIILVFPLCGGVASAFALRPRTLRRRAFQATR